MYARSSVSFKNLELINLRNRKCPSFKSSREFDYPFVSKMCFQKFGETMKHFNFVDHTKALMYRKDVPCFYRAIETQVTVWENKKCCGNTSRRRVFSQLFRVLPNFHDLWLFVHTPTPSEVHIYCVYCTVEAKKRKTT